MPHNWFVDLKVYQKEINRYKIFIRRWENLLGRTIRSWPAMTEMKKQMNRA